MVLEVWVSDGSVDAMYNVEFQGGSGCECQMVLEVWVSDGNVDAVYNVECEGGSKGRV